MKKTYIAPSLVCVKMEAMQMLAGSDSTRTMTIDKEDTTNSAFSEKKDWSEQIWGEQIWDE